MGIGRVSRYLSVPLAAAVVLLLLAGVAPLPVRAGTNYAVTVTMSDENSLGGNSDVIHPLGCAFTGLGNACSLRDAVLFADDSASVGDTATITLPTGTFTLQIAGMGEDQGNTGDLDLFKNITIVGAGAGTTVIQASKTGSAMGIDRVFDVGVLNAATTTISGVTIRYGNAGSGADGGGIAVRLGSSLTLNNCAISGNATNGRGGGISNAGTLTMTNSTVAADSSTGASGGGIANTGTLTVTNSTLSGNHADSPTQGGGGIYAPSGTVTLMNSTVAANTANGFVPNQPPNGGGGIANLASTLTAVNTLIAGNTATGGTGPDADGAFATGSKNNLLGNGSGASGITNNDANHNLVGTTANPIIPLLDPTLRDNNTTTGTQTLALLPGSPAINAGDNATCANTTGVAPVTGLDQRGVTRPQPSSGRCDIGAFEFVFAATATALTASPNPSAFGQAVIFTATVSGGGPPTGSVTFKEGATVLATIPLNGVAPFTTTALAVGSHAITAVYSGDATSPPSTSAVLTQVVTAPATVQSITVTATTTTIPVGGTDQFTATCTYADSTTGNCTASVTWSSDTPSVATVTAAGLVTGIAAGTAKITGTVGAVTGSANVTVTAGSPPPASGLQFYPLTKPVRLLDTRSGSTAFVAPNTKLTAGQTLSLPGQFSYQGVTIPPTAQAIVGNATVANGSNGTPPGFATIFPSGVPLPLTSNLNFVPGTVRPNAFTVALGADTKFNLYSSSGGDFVVDISGYYAPVGAGGLYFHPLAAPVRELDTRSGATAFVHPNAPLTAGQTLTLPGSFTANSIAIPSSAKALVGNATVANGSNGTPAGFATLFPDDVPLPLASNLNFVPGTVAPNAFTVALGGGDGGYNLYSSTGGDFVVDITGYLDTTAAGGLLFTPLSAPVRELDTRAGATAFVHPSATLTAGQTLTLPGAFTYNSITIPASAKALVGNATVANDGNATPAGFATLYPDGVPLPLASNLNFVPGQVAPNAVVVGVGSDGKYDLYSSSGGDFIIDITGYFAAAPGSAAKPTAPSSPHP